MSPKTGASILKVEVARVLWTPCHVSLWSCLNMNVIERDLHLQGVIFRVKRFILFPCWFPLEIIPWCPIAWWSSVNQVLNRIGRLWSWRLADGSPVPLQASSARLTELLYLRLCVLLRGSTKSRKIDLATNVFWQKSMRLARNFSSRRTQTSPDFIWNNHTNTNIHKNIVSQIHKKMGCFLKIIFFTVTTLVFYKYKIRYERRSKRLLSKSFVSRPLLICANISLRALPSSRSRARARAHARVAYIQRKVRKYETRKQTLRDSLPPEISLLNHRNSCSIDACQPLISMSDKILSIRV